MLLTFPCFSEDTQAPDYAEKPVEDINDREQVAKEKFIDYQRVALTNRFIDLTDGLDRFLSRKNGGDRLANNSYFVVGLESVFNQGGDQDHGVNLKLKADLPDTRQRFKFIFESQPDEDLSLEQNELAGKSTNNRLERETAIAGLEYVIKAKEFQWRPSIDVGARLDFPFDTFARVRFQKKTSLPSNWTLNNRFEFSYFAREGAKPRMKFAFEKAFDNHFKFGTVMRYKYSRQQKLHELLQSIYVDHLVNETLALEYKVGAFGDDEFKTQVTGYFVNIAVKKRFYRDWLYASFTPEVNYLRENDWSPFYSLTLGLQAVYSE